MKKYAFAFFILFSSPIYASPACDAEVTNFHNYYSAVLPEKLINSTSNNFSGVVLEEKEKAKKQHSSFYDACIWQDTIKGNIISESYRETDRLLTSIDSYLALFRVTTKEDEIEYILSQYCRFISKGVSNFPECITRSEP